MPHWEYLGPVLQRDGSTQVERIVLEADHRPHPDAVQVAAAGEAPLGSMRDALLQRLKALRDTNEFGVITVPQGQLQIDERSQGRLARAIKVAEEYEEATGQAFTTYWRMFDNSDAPVNLAVLKGWTLLIGAQVQHVFSVYGERFKTIMNADRAGLAALAAEIGEGWDVGAL